MSRIERDHVYHEVIATTRRRLIELRNIIDNELEVLNALNRHGRYSCNDMKDDDYLYALYAERLDTLVRYLLITTNSKLEGLRNSLAELRVEVLEATVNTITREIFEEMMDK
ncbi:MAG: hypothetical protein QW593_05310 [Candidatus Nitrosocaldus sp.]